jgi:hypothetical protein
MILHFGKGRSCGISQFKVITIIRLSISFLLLTCSFSFAADTLSVSGRLNIVGVYALDDNSIKEDPSLDGRIRLDAQKSGWRFHSWLEGGWDGTVRNPHRAHSLFKNYRDVYQDNTPYLEFKELYLERSFATLDVRAGIQRFAWGRLDEYPVNDLFNPWDYTRFIVRPMEDRKIGVPSVSATLNRGDWSYQAVWVPWLVPYRLPKPNERWAGVPVAPLFSRIPNAEIVSEEPDLPSKDIGNSSLGLRIQRMGEIEWAVNLFHGYDLRPVFKTTKLNVLRQSDKFVIDPGYLPSFHKITSLGIDAAAVSGDWSFRAEAAYTFNRYYNVRQELWGYPRTPVFGVTTLNPIEARRDALDYGIAADYRLFEDGQLTIQAQQTIIFKRPDTLFEKAIETILWAGLKVGWMNRKIETDLNVAYNPEHRGTMVRGEAYYILGDSWKAGVNGILLDGQPQSLFGKYAMNDQVGMEVIFSW